MEEIRRWFEQDITLEGAMDCIAENLRATVRNFVAIGFYLKAIRDKKLYQEDDCQNFEEFVRKHYDRDKGWASKCIKVNDQLSEGGNSPLLDNGYSQYKVSQLVELAYLTEEQRELASPEMTVKQLQAIRKPEPQPDPEVVISQQEAEPVRRNESEEKVAISQLDQETSCPPGIHDCRRQEWGTSQKEQASGHKECEKCRSEWKSRTEVLETGKPREDLKPEPDYEEDASVNQEREEILCNDCSDERNVDGEEACAAHEDLVAHAEPAEQPLDEGIWKPWEEEQLPDERYNIGDLPQAKEKYLRRLAQILVEKMGMQLRELSVLGCLSDDSIKQKIMQLDKMEHRKIVLGDNVEAGACAQIIEFWSGDEDLGTCSYQRIATQVRKALDSQNERLEEESEPDQGEGAAEPEESELTDLQIARHELERAKELLRKCLKDLPDENNVYIRGMKIKVAALASLVCDMEDIENPPLKPEQPELLVLKNNDQRAAFVDGYETWPLWIETEQTGERYYRYDLVDGTSMVVKVYHAMLFDYKVTGLNYEERFAEGYGQQEYYLLQPGKFFKDCEANRSALIEKLKEIQKKER